MKLQISVSEVPAHLMPKISEINRALLDTNKQVMAKVMSLQGIASGLHNAVHKMTGDAGEEVVDSVEQLLANTQKLLSSLTKLGL